REDPMTHRVDTVMPYVKPPARDTVVDRVAAEAQAEKLRAPDDAVLPLGEGADQRVRGTRERSTAYIAVDRSLDLHAATMAPKPARVARGELRLCNETSTARAQTRPRSLSADGPGR